MKFSSQYIAFFQYESQSSFCSVQKTRIDGNNMFCDFYNPTNQTYCKRLRVLCPEHYKDPKISDNEVRHFLAEFLIEKIALIYVI